MITFKSFYVDATKGVDLINVGHEVRRVVREAKSENGWVTIMAPHPGAGVAVMEADEKKIGEIRKGLEQYLASGLLRCLLAKSQVVPIRNGGLILEPWQEIFLIDYETTGKRREFLVQLFAEKKETDEHQG